MLTHNVAGGGAGQLPKNDKKNNSECQSDISIGHLIWPLEIVFFYKGRVKDIFFQTVDKCCA